MPGGGEDGVADGDQGAFFAAALDDPLVAGGQEGAGAGGAGGGFAEGAAEPGVALAGGGGLAAPGGLAGPGRELGPGHQVAGGGEAGHVGAGLGEQVLGGGHADPGDLVELGYLGGERGDRLLDPGPPLSTNAPPAGAAATNLARIVSSGSRPTIRVTPSPAPGPTTPRI